MPFDSNCGGCWNHGDSRDGVGQCRALPPDQPTYLPPILPVSASVGVTVMTYICTADDCPACGLFRPLVEPELPAAETKADRIARLCKGGNVSVIEMKRAIEGR